MTKKVLITGVAGFLGSHLCDKFLSENYYVIGMDNFITGDEDNIRHLDKNNNFQFIPPSQSGFFTPYDNRDINLIQYQNKQLQFSVSYLKDLGEVETIYSVKKKEMLVLENPKIGFENIHMYMLTVPYVFLHDLRVSFSGVKFTKIRGFVK